MQTMRDQIFARIERLGPGKAFSAKDFLDIASRGTIDMAFGSLIRGGKIRRVRRGLYDMPKINEALGGKPSPDIDEAARAIADGSAGRSSRMVPGPLICSAFRRRCLPNHLSNGRSEQRSTDRTPDYSFQACTAESDGWAGGQVCARGPGAPISW